MKWRTAALALSIAARAQAQLSLDTLVPALMKKYDVPGVSLAIVRGDSVLALRGYGYARIRDSARVDPQRTLFRLASVSKLFVATAVMQQVESGALDMNADVNRYLAWRVPATWSAPVTLDRLLTHTAGFDERLIGYAATSRDSIGDLGAHLASNLPYRGWKPGEVIGYSNYGVALAAHVVERASGMSFERYAREHVFEPLGMTRTYYVHVPDSLRANVGDGHFCGPTRCETAPEVFSHPYPVGLAYSTAADMARFLMAQLGSGKLSPTLVAAMQAQHFTGDPMVAGMSYAFFNQTHLGHRVLAHGGNVPGINNLLVIVPDERLGIYFAANGGRTAFGAALRDSLFARLITPRAVARAAPVKLSEDYLRSLAGPYQIARYAHHTIEAFPSVFATAVSLTIDSGRVVLPYPHGAMAFEPVDSLHFREVRGDHMIAFRRDASGHVAQLIAPIPFFGAEVPGVLERRPWYEGAHFLNEYVSWLLLGPLIILIGAWPLATLGAWWLRRRRGVVGPPRSIPARYALGAGVLFNAIWIVFGFGFIARSTRMFGNATGLVFGVTGDMRALSVLPWLMAVSAAVIVAGTVLAFRRGWWDPLRRVLYSGVAAGAVLTIVFLVRWNYLPVRF
jgi:CubicO group peptidase (beta-lactamase class C family)